MSRWLPLLGSLVLGHVALSTTAVAQEQEYFLVAKHSGKCLHQHGATFGDDDPITQWDCVNEPNVRLKKIDRGDGRFWLKFVHSDKCVHVNMSSYLDNVGSLTQWTCIDQNNLHWREVAASDGYSYFSSLVADCIGVRRGSADNGAIIKIYPCIDEPSVQWKLVPAK